MREAIDALRSLKKYIALALAEEDGDIWEVRFAHEEGTFHRPFCRVGPAGPLVMSGSAYLQEAVRPFNVLCHPVEAVNTEAAVLEAERVGGILTNAVWRGTGPIPPPASIGANAGFDAGPGVLPAGSYTYGVASVTRHGKSEVTYLEAPLTITTQGGATLIWPPAPGARAYRVYRGEGLDPAGVIAEVTDPFFIDDGTRRMGSPASPRGTLGLPKRLPLWDWGPAAWNQTTVERGEPDYLQVRDYNVNVVRDPADELLLVVTADIRLAWRTLGLAANEGPPLAGIETVLEPRV